MTLRLPLGVQEATYLLPDELFADARPQVHDLQLGRLEHSVRGELHVGLALMVTLHAHVAQVPVTRDRSCQSLSSNILRTKKLM